MREKLTEQEVKNLLDNVEYYRLQKWMSQKDLVIKSNNHRLPVILSAYKYRGLKAANHVIKLAEVLECTPKQLLAPLTKDFLPLATRDFLKEAVQKKQINGFNSISIVTKIPKERLQEVITLRTMKFNQDEIKSLHAMKFSLPTLAPFADPTVDLTVLTKGKYMGRYSLMGGAPLNKRQLIEFDQCEAILKKYGSELPQKTAKKFTGVETYDFYLSLKQQWGNIKPGGMDKYMIRDVITKVCSSKIFLGTSVFLASALKSLPAKAAEIVAEGIKNQMDINALATNQKNRPIYYFANRFGSHMATFGLLIPKGIDGVLSTSILGDNPPYTIFTLPFRTIDNFVFAQGYSQSIVSDWKDLSGWILKKISNEPINQIKNEPAPSSYTPQRKAETSVKPNNTNTYTVFKNSSSYLSSSPIDKPFDYSFKSPTKLVSAPRPNDHVEHKKIATKNSPPVSSAPSSFTHSRKNPSMFTKSTKGIEPKTNTPTFNVHPNNKLDQIYKSQTETSVKITQIFGEIHSAYQVINQLKSMEMKQEKAELALANFQTVQQGFSLLSQLGQQTGNRSLEKIGGIGSALTGATYGIAQLTGILGVPQVAGGLAMAGPIFAVGAAALALAPMLFGGDKAKKQAKKQAKAMQEMFKGLSGQISQVNQATIMVNNNLAAGFAAMQEGFNFLNQKMDAGFNSTHQAMAQHFSNTTKQINLLAEFFNQQYEKLVLTLNKSVEAIIESQMNLFEAIEQKFGELDYKLDKHYLFLNRIDEKLTELSADLQELGFKNDIDNKKKLFLLSERFDQSQDKKSLLKLLQAIRDQLYSGKGILKSLKMRSSSFSGWFHLDALIPLFNHPDFQEFAFDYSNLVNLPWVQSSYDSYNLLLSILEKPEFNDATIKKLHNEISSLIKKTATPTSQFVKALASKDFLSRFFAHYDRKLDNLHARLELILKPMRENLTQSAIREYAKKYLKDFQQAPNQKELLSSLADSSQKIASQISEHAQQKLMELVKEYNACIHDFKSTTNVIFSLLEIDEELLQPFKIKFEALKSLSEIQYCSKSIVEIKHDKTLPENAVYSFLNFNTVNYFKKLNISSEELLPIVKNASEYADLSAIYLQLVNQIANKKELFEAELILLANQFHFKPDNVRPNEEIMKEKILKSEIMDKLIKDIQPLYSIANQVKDESLVYVIGITGDGKSTFVNWMNGTHYGKQAVGYKVVPQRIGGSAEICKVGLNSAVSETFLPQVVKIPFGDSYVTYCDLPGLDGTRDEATTICELYAPMVLNKQVSNVKGIVWVLNILHFEVTRSEKVKEMLQNLLKIADPQTLAKSLTLVVTKGNKKLTKEHVLTEIENAINGMTNSEKKEKKLLNEIWLQLSKPESNQIIITKIFEPNSEQVNEIHQTVNTRTAVDKSNFDFSAYCPTQQNFKEELERAIQYHQTIVDEHDAMEMQVTQSKHVLDLKEQAQVLLQTQTAQLKSTNKEEKENLEDKRLELETCQRKITELETSTEQVKIGVLNYVKDPVTQTREIDEPTGQYTLQDSGTFRTVKNYKNVCIGYEQIAIDTQTHGYFKPCPREISAYNAFKAIHEFQGYKIFELSYMNGRYPAINGTAIKYANDLNRPIYTIQGIDVQEAIKVQVPIMRKKMITEPVPYGNLAEHPLSFLSNLPVDLLLLEGNKGWNVVPNTENKQSGYHAMISYEKGQGFTVNMEIRVSKKNSDDGAKELEVLRAKKNNLDREILGLAQKAKEFDAQIQKNTLLLEILNQELTAFGNQKQELESKLEAFRAFLNTKKNDFELLSQLQAIILDTKPNPTNVSPDNKTSNEDNDSQNKTESKEPDINTAPVKKKESPASSASLRFFSKTTSNAGALFPWYSCNDILKCLESAIKNDLGGFSTDCNYLLKNQYADLDGKNYSVAVIDAIDTDGGIPIEFFFDSSQQPAPNLGNSDHRRDLFDDIHHLIESPDNQNIKILFAYNRTNFHWLTAEIQIHKEGDNYNISLSAHDPYGEGNLKFKNYNDLAFVLGKKINQFNANAKLNFSSLPSPFGQRQSHDDGNSCGVIVIEDMLKRIRGESLNIPKPYPVGAQELREKHQIENPQYSGTYCL